DDIFFFQAEDGIRDFHVTGVQTCALPILAWPSITASSARSERLGSNGEPPEIITANTSSPLSRSALQKTKSSPVIAFQDSPLSRSEERRVGKEWRARWEP